MQPAGTASGDKTGDISGSMEAKGTATDGTTVDTAVPLLEQNAEGLAVHSSESPVHSAAEHSEARTAASMDKQPALDRFLSVVTTEGGEGPFGDKLQAELEHMKADDTESCELLRTLRPLVETIVQLEEKLEGTDAKLRQSQDYGHRTRSQVANWEQPGSILWQDLLETRMIDISFSIRNLCGLFKGMDDPYDCMFELQGFKAFKKVASNYVTLLHETYTRRLLYEAFVWDFIVTNVFEAENSLWAGPPGENFEKLCSQIQGMLV